MKVGDLVKYETKEGEKGFGVITETGGWLGYHPRIWIKTFDGKEFYTAQSRVEVISEHR